MQHHQQEAESPTRMSHPQYFPHHNPQQEHAATGIFTSTSTSTSTTSTSVMEQVLFQLHLRSCHFGLRYLSASTRRLLEHLLLMVAIAGFGALILLHRNFVFREEFNAVQINNNTSGKHYYNCAYTCLASIPHLDPTADLYLLSILPTSTSGTQSYVLEQEQSYKNKKVHVNTVGGSGPSATCPLQEQDSDLASSSTTCTSTSTTVPYISYSYSRSKAYLMLQSSNRHDSLLQHLDVQHIVVSPHDPHCFGEPFLQFLIHECGIGYETIVWNWFVHLFHWQQNKHDDGDGDDNNHSRMNHINNNNNNNMVGYVYSTRTGQLQELRPPFDSAILGGEHPSSQKEQQQQQHQKQQQQKASQPLLFEDTEPKFSSSFSLLDRFQQFLKQKGLFRGRSSFAGFVSKLAVLIKTSFLFLFSTTLISFTLRETQERMLEFTQELSRRVAVQLAVGDLVIFHLIHNVVFVPIMVGMMFFLIEFYGGDKLLAFLVMTIVWCVEVFSVISLRSDQGITFFPRIFFLLFCLFHIYYFANPQGGFKYTALAVVGCFMLHSMAFFWHRYELPAVALGRVTIDRPRYEYRAAATSTSSTMHSHPHPSPSDANTTFGAATSTSTTSTTTSPVVSRTLFSVGNNDGRLLRVALDDDPPSPPLIRSQTTPTNDHNGNPSLEFQPIPSPPSQQEYPDPTSTTATTLPTMAFRFPPCHAVAAAAAAAIVTRPITDSFSSHNDSSTQNSSTLGGAAIFRRDNDIDNDDDDDDDDDQNDHGGEDDESSYVYFMQGEVVVHRPRSTHNNNIASGAPVAAALLSTVESSHTLASTTSGQDQQQPPLLVPPRGTPGPSESGGRQGSPSPGLDADGMFADFDDNNNDNQRPADTIVYSSPDRVDWQQQQQHQQHQQQRGEQELMYSGEDSKSGLQSILEVRLTPRHRNGTDILTTTTTTGDTMSSSTSPSITTSEPNCRPSLDQHPRVTAGRSSSPPTFPKLPS